MTAREWRTSIAFATQSVVVAAHCERKGLYAEPAQAYD